MIEVALFVLTLVGALAIVLYSTWLIGKRLRAGEAGGPTFREWLKNLSEAFFGL